MHFENMLIVAARLVYPLRFESHDPDVHQIRYSGSSADPLKVALPIPSGRGAWEKAANL
jgi:hypothetical protein